MTSAGRLVQTSFQASRLVQTSFRAREKSREEERLEGAEDAGEPPALPGDDPTSQAITDGSLLTS